LLTAYPKDVGESVVATDFQYFHWRRREPNFPCLYAKRYPHSSPGAVLLRDIASGGPADIANEIEQVVDGAIRNASTLVVAMCVPAWASDERLMAESFVALHALPGWELKVHAPIRIAQQQVLPVGLHRQLRAQTGDSPAVESVPMALGPFDTFPTSRRCPVPVLELGVDARCVGKRLHAGRLRADFLAMPTPWLDKAERKKVRKMVEENTRKVNGGVDPRAHYDNTATFSMVCTDILHV
jgi:hypothetical protein